MSKLPRSLPCTSNRPDGISRSAARPSERFFFALVGNSLPAFSSPFVLLARPRSHSLQPGHERHSVRGNSDSSISGRASTGPDPVVVAVSDRQMKLNTKTIKPPLLVSPAIFSSSFPPRRESPTGSYPAANGTNWQTVGACARREPLVRI